MRFTFALAALVAATSALPSALQSMGKYALNTREDFVEDDFEIQAEPDDPAKRSVGWPEVSPSGRNRNSDLQTHGPPLFYKSPSKSAFPFGFWLADPLCLLHETG